MARERCACVYERKRNNNANVYDNTHAFNGTSAYANHYAYDYASYNAYTNIFYNAYTYAIYAIDNYSFYVLDDFKNFNHNMVFF